MPSHPACSKGALLRVLTMMTDHRTNGDAMSQNNSITNWYTEKITGICFQVQGAKTIKSMFALDMVHQHKRF